MTQDKTIDIQRAVISAIAGFGVNPSESYQSMGLIGLSEMRRDISQNELLSVLKTMEGVILDFDVSPAEVRIPTRYFIGE